MICNVLIKTHIYAAIERQEIGLQTRYRDNTHAHDTKVIDVKGQYEPTDNEQLTQRHDGRPFILACSCIRMQRVQIILRKTCFQHFFQVLSKYHRFPGHSQSMHGFLFEGAGARFFQDSFKWSRSFGSRPRILRSRGCCASCGARGSGVLSCRKRSPHICARTEDGLSPQAKSLK